MHQDWVSGAAGAAAPPLTGPRPTPERFRHLLRAEQETLESLRPGATREAESPQAHKGHDVRGRFTKGNKCGTGNPFARQVAGFRKALVNAATDEDFAELAQVLLAKAKGGDLAAIKLFFTYTVGKPTEAPDPDRLELDDFRLLRERLGLLEEDWHQIRQMVPVEGITEAGHRVADLRAECWRAEVLGPAAPEEARGSAAAPRARPAESAAAAAPAKPATAAFVKGLLRALNEQTERSLAALGAVGAAPPANGGTAAGAPSANGDTAVRAPSPNGGHGNHPPSANGGHGHAAPSANGRDGPPAPRMGRPNGAEGDAPPLTNGR